MKSFFGVGVVWKIGRGVGSVGLVLVGRVGSGTRLEGFYLLRTFKGVVRGLEFAVVVFRWILFFVSCFFE